MCVQADSGKPADMRIRQKALGLVHPVEGKLCLDQAVHPLSV